MKISFRCVLNCLTYKKVRTLLTIISIAIGVFSVVLITAIANIGKSAINYELDSLGIGGVIITATNPSNFSIVSTDVTTVKDFSAVQAATPVMMNVSTGIVKNNGSDITLWGVNSDAAKVIRIELLHGRLINENDVSSCANVCIIDSDLALKNYKRENIVGKSIRILVGSTYETFEVVGVVKSGGNVLQSLVGSYIPNFVYIPYTTMQTYNHSLKIDTLAVKFYSNIDINQSANSIINTLEVKNGATDAYKFENLSQQKDTLNNMLDIITSVLTAIGCVSVIVAGISIMTVMMVAVSERTREIGIKKAIGAGKLQIMLEFMTESLVISLIGSVLGGVLGQTVACVGAYIIGSSISFGFSIIVACVVGALIISAVFGIYPAYTAAKMKPVDALKFE